MYFAKTAAALAAALFCLASPATAQTNQNSKALAFKLKSLGVGRAGSFPKGQVFSFYIDYGELPPPAGSVGALDVYVSTANFKAALYEKNIYADAAKTTKIGNALYNIQIFDQSATLAEGNYQSVQNVPLKNKKGQTVDAYININGRIEYTIPNGQQYPVVTNAKILSIAVSSLEIDGMSCVNVGVNPIRSDPANPASITEYIIDARKAVCVPQTFNQG